MKILGGQYKGRNFYMPLGIKPTQNLLRAALFDVIGHELSGISFLELFAGSGAISLEAISRGVDDLVMVEHNELNVKTIHENCTLLNIPLGDKYRLIHGDAFTQIKRLSDEGRRFDIVFFDPPYGLALAKKTLKLLTSRDILHGQSLVIAQYEQGESLICPEGFNQISHKKYGSSYLTIFEKVAK